MKTEFSRGDAIALAHELVQALRTVTVGERVSIAGSLRHRKTEVGDIEVLDSPLYSSEPDGLFDIRQVN